MKTAVKFKKVASSQLIWDGVQQKTKKQGSKRWIFYTLSYNFICLVTSQITSFQAGEKRSGGGQNRSC